MTFTTADTANNYVRGAQSLRKAKQNFETLNLKISTEKKERKMRFEDLKSP